MDDYSNIRRNPDIVEHASDWMARLDRGLTSKEERRFQSWLFEDDDHLVVFMELARMWDRMDVLSSFAVATTGPKPRRDRLSHWAIAASVMAVAVTVLSLFDYSDIRFPPWGDPSGKPQTFQTAMGERSEYQLDDGTTISLNTDSLATVEYTPKNRFIYLEKGEIHVDVAHDPSRPLSVYFDGHIVQAVGTEFNVDISDDQNIEIVVTEGIVSVGVLDRSITETISTEPVVLPSTSSLVAAGEGAVVDRKKQAPEEVTPERLKDEEIAVRLSWRYGNLIFRGESLEEAITEVGRYTAIEFIILDENAKKERVAGMFKAGDVDGLLTTLRENFNITYERVSDNKVLLGSAEAE